MSQISDRFLTELTPGVHDSERGSLRMIAKLLGRLGQPNSITAGSVQTAAVGTDYTALASGTGVRIVADNTTGTSLTFRRVGTTPTLAFASGARIDLPLVANQNEWEVKRTDDSNTQVTLAFLRHAIV
jgi:hypothetical protein